MAANRLVCMIQRSRYVAITFTVSLIVIAFWYLLYPSQQDDTDTQYIRQSSLQPLITVLSDQAHSESINHDLITDTSLRTTASEVEEDEALKSMFTQTEYLFDKFTMITPTYKRTNNLPLLFDHYCTMTDIIHKIIVLWNNVGEEIPAEITEYAKDCEVQVVIKIMPKNNLTSRFIPYKEIETAGVLSIDDDLKLSLSSIHLAFDTWKRFPYLLVGYTPRTYMLKYNRYKYYYQMYKGLYTMMMTNVAFIHRKYLQLFTETLPKDIVDYIISTTNGEDITMNVVVGKYLTDLGKPQCVAMYIHDNGLKEIGNLSQSGYKGLWRRKGHMKQRSQCLNLLNQVYGGLYLHDCNVMMTANGTVHTHQ